MTLGVNMLQHRSKTLPFDELYSALERSVANGLSYRKTAPWGNNLVLYTYTKECVFNREWDDITVLARGLILDVVKKKVLATPFPKFFNYGERLTDIPDGSFEAYEKVDGSLIIVYHDGEMWTTATKGSFISSQAQWAYNFLTKNVPFEDYFNVGSTYLFEAVYPENRIVVKYPEPTLVLLGAYDEEGWELGTIELQHLARNLGLRAAEVFTDEWDTIEDVVEHSKGLPASHEGYVLKFDDGTRIKIKGDEYCRIHRLISRVTPLAIWEMLRANDNMTEVAKEIPEEFRDDFNTIMIILQNQVMAIVMKLMQIHKITAEWTDKELGLAENVDQTTKGLLFSLRKSGEPVGIQAGSRAWNQVFEMVRPTGNVLEGYYPSNAMNRIQEDAE